MGIQVVFDGTVLWERGEGGISHRLTAGIPRTLGSGPLPGVTLPGLIETVAEVGTGIWLKPGGVDPAQHNLELTWETNDKPGLRSLVQSVGGRVGLLVVPDEGSFARCALTGAGEFSGFKSDGGLYVVSVSLTFTQYP